MRCYAILRARKRAPHAAMLLISALAACTLEAAVRSSELKSLTASSPSIDNAFWITHDWHPLSGDDEENEGCTAVVRFQVGLQDPTWMSPSFVTLPMQIGGNKSSRTIMSSSDSGFFTSTFPEPQLDPDSGAVFAAACAALDTPDCSMSLLRILERPVGGRTSENTYPRG